jgi:ribonuclease R
MNTANAFDTIVLSPFPKNVIDQANVAARLKPSSLLAKRLDLRGKTVFSFVNAPEAVSSVAFSVYRFGSGWKLGVHVADVAEYVCENSPLDSEAKKRLATVKNGFVSSDMLPEKIQEICGLSVGEDKLAVSVLLDIDANGELVSIEFEESIIRVAQSCVFKEIDELVFATDASAVFGLRKKYGAYFDNIAAIYELAALFCNKRRDNDGLDCEVFHRVFEDDENGKTVAFRRIKETDTQAMIREIGYYVSYQVGNYFYKKKMPCIYVGTETIPDERLDYLCDLVGVKKNAKTASKRMAEIADKAKGSDYYDFVCDSLANSLPCANYSDKPIFNSLCGQDKLVSFINPARKYSDLLTQRFVKTFIAAKGNPTNLNLNRYRKEIKIAAEKATAVSEFAYNTSKKFSNMAALEYLEQNLEKNHSGFTLIKEDDGSVTVILECGALATVSPENAKNFNFEAARLYCFEIVSLGDENKLTEIRPVKE